MAARRARVQALGTKKEGTSNENWAKPFPYRTIDERYTPLICTACVHAAMPACAVERSTAASGSDGSSGSCGACCGAHLDGRAVGEAVCKCKAVVDVVDVTVRYAKVPEAGGQPGGTSRGACCPTCRAVTGCTEAGRTAPQLAPLPGSYRCPQGASRHGTSAHGRLPACQPPSSCPHFSMPGGVSVNVSTTRSAVPAARGVLNPQLQHIPLQTRPHSCTTKAASLLCCGG